MDNNILIEPRLSRKDLRIILGNLKSDTIIIRLEKEGKLHRCPNVPGILYDPEEVRQLLNIKQTVKNAKEYCADEW